jgi:hypothetical protein
LIFNSSYIECSIIDGSAFLPPKIFPALLKNKMDFAHEQLVAVEQKIKELVKNQIPLQMKEQKGTITEEEEIELADIHEWWEQRV